MCARSWNGKKKEVEEKKSVYDFVQILYHFLVLNVILNKPIKIEYINKLHKCSFLQILQGYGLQSGVGVDCHYSRGIGGVFDC